MTPKQFIEKAIEGGFDINKVVSFIATEDHIEFKPNPNITHFVDFYKMVLDPLAWQAVGRVEGWKQRLEVDNPSIGNMSSYEELVWIGKEWEYNMYRMIDALVEGKTIEQFLETL